MSDTLVLIDAESGVKDGEEAILGLPMTVADFRREAAITVNEIAEEKNERGRSWVGVVIRDNCVVFSDVFET